jgi:hypothetical protein
MKNMAEKVRLWKNLNYIRVAVFVAVSIGLIPLCMKVLNLRIN